MRLQLKPSLEEFRELAARGNVIAVSAEFVADAETPVSAFKKLQDGGYSFLFESTEKNDVSGRFSFLGTSPRAVIKSYGREISVTTGDKERRFSADGDPLDEVRKLMSGYRFVAQPKLPRFCGGAVGFLGYEAIGFFESKVPSAAKDELHLPEMLFMLTSSLLAFDHRLRTITVVVNAFTEDGAVDDVYDCAAKRIAEIVGQLASPADLPLMRPTEYEPSSADALETAPKAVPTVRSNLSRTEFEAAVGCAKEYIRAGDVFQVVLSQRFECDYSGSAVEFYRALRFINPSPYMFCLRFGDEFALVGSSPEMHVRLVDGTIDIRPIAGTRPRGATAEADERNAAELLADEKERAEHIMLVDLARNDIGRVAEIGSVRVTELMNVERYSHVMHIVSNVRARLREGCTAFDLIRATFPAGTVSGAPKIRAMQMIAELEGTRRGCYAGTIGYLGFDGNFDSCIALRSAVLKHGKAYFQAGAGIVADSDPSAEFNETLNKARAVRQALRIATQRQPR